MQTRSIQINANSDGKNFGRSKSPSFPRGGTAICANQNLNREGTVADTNMESGSTFDQTDHQLQFTNYQSPLTDYLSTGCQSPSYQLLITSHQITNHLSPTVQISSEV
jgi:hypothetical protein